MITGDWIGGGMQKSAVGTSTCELMIEGWGLSLLCLRRWLHNCFDVDVRGILFLSEHPEAGWAGSHLKLHHIVQQSRVTPFFGLHYIMQSSIGHSEPWNRARSITLERRFQFKEIESTLSLVLRSLMRFPSHFFFSALQHGCHCFATSF